MARIPNYTDDQGVQLNLPLIDGASSRVSNSGAEMANKLFGMRGNDWMRVSEFANSMAIKRQAQRNAAEVSNAIAAATLQLDELRNAQLDRKGLDAQGAPATEGGVERLSAIEDYSDNAGQIQESIKNKLLNDVQKQKFDEWYRTRYVNDMDRVAQHQQAQLDAAEESGALALIASAKDSAFGSMMRGEFGSAWQTIEDKREIHKSVKGMQGMPEEVINQDYQSTVIYDTVKKAIDQKIKDGDEDGAAKILEYFGKHLTEEQRAGLKGTVRPAVEKASATNFVKTHAIYNADGTLNIAAMYKLAEEEGARRGKLGTMDFSGGTEHQQKVAAYVFEHAKDYGIDPYLALSHIAIEAGEGFDSAVAIQGNNYGGINASGVTDLPKPANEGGGYYEHYDSMEEGLDAVLKLLKLYDVDKATTVEEWNDLLKADPNAQYYTSDKAERVRYHNQLWNEYRSHGKSEGPDEEFIKNAKAQIDLMYRDNQIQLQQRDKDRLENFNRAVMDGSIKNMSDVFQYCKSNGFTENQTVAFGHRYREANGLLDEKDKALQAAALNVIDADIQSGKITSAEQLKNYPLTEEQKKQLEKAFFDKNMAWRQLDGVNGFISDAIHNVDEGAKGRAKFDLVCMVNKRIEENMRNNPMYRVDAWEIRAIIDEMKGTIKRKQESGEYWFYPSTIESAFPKYAIAQLGPLFDYMLDSNRAMLKDGHIATWNEETYTYDIN